MFRTTLSALVVAVVFGFASNANAANFEVSLKHTGWIGETTNSQGEKLATGMVFRDDGKFVFMLEVGGKIEKLEGTYTIEGHLIRINIGGEKLVLDVVSVDGETLVTSGSKGKTTWNRLKQ